MTADLFDLAADFYAYHRSPHSAGCDHTKPGWSSRRTRIDSEPEIAAMSLAPLQAHQSKLAPRTHTCRTGIA